MDNFVFLPGIKDTMKGLFLKSYQFDFKNHDYQERNIIITPFKR